MLADCPEVNWGRVCEALGALRPRRDTVVLLDGDRTLAAEDTSRLFLELAGLPLGPIKEAFQRHGYSYPGFLFHSTAYLQVAAPDFERHCEAVAESVPLYPGVREFIGRALERADVYVVTAGIASIWSRLLSRAGLSVPVLGGSHHGARYLLGRDEKGRLCGRLQSEGRRVVAFGDSDVDSLMLRGAERAVVVVNHRRNEDLLPHLLGHPAVYQISFGAHLHPGIPRIDFQVAHQILEGG